MRTKQIRNSFLLVITALIWGIAFVAQSEGGDAVGPYSFNGIRSLIGATVLLPVIFFLDKKGLSPKKPRTAKDKKMLWTGGVSCGVVLFLATTLQQVAINMGTPAGKAGFMTACYILIVPILGIFFKRKCGLNIWLGVALTVLGLYLLCMNGGFSIKASDMLLLGSAFCFAVQIMLVDHFSPIVDGVRLSSIQFLTCGIISMFPMFFIDMGHSLGGIAEWSQAFTSLTPWIAILYAGILSCGVAYTLQIIGQDGLNPTVASMIMSLESVFSVLAGLVILKQILSGREIMGCVLIFAAIALAQIPFKSRKKSIEK